MKKFLYRMACKTIELIGAIKVVPVENFDKAYDLLERAYRFYLTSNREESDEAYIEGLFNMAKIFIGKQCIINIKNRILGEVNSHGKIGRNL